MTIKTVEQARALPEIRSAMMTDDGAPRMLSGEPISGDSIVWFSDADGRSMEVIHTAEQGWCKTAMRG